MRFGGIQSALVVALVRLGDVFLRTIQGILWAGPRPLEAGRICVHRIGNLGDILCALPAMRAIRRAYPRAHLVLATYSGKGRPGARELLEGASWIDAVVEEGDAFRQRFDLWFELPPNITRMRSAAHYLCRALQVRARWARGWRVGTIRWFRQAQSENLVFPNEVDRLLDILSREGLEVASPTFGLAPGPAQEERLKALLQGFPLEPARLMAIAPGAGRLMNRWPMERFVAVGAALARVGYRIVVLGGADDDGLCRIVAEGIGESARSLAGKTTVLESCAILERCRLLICNDSGVLHMAAAVGTPCVVVCSARDIKGKWHPFGGQHTVLRKWVECHTCLLEECPNEGRCLKEISVEEVEEAALRTLELGLNPATGG